MNITAADRIPGMMSAQQLSWLAEQASKHQRIAEIGCWRGRTTRVLCDNTPGKVTAIDTWLGSPGLEDEILFMESATSDPDWLYHEFQRNLSGATNLEIVRKSSLVAANYFAVDESGRTFDFIFIDGLHDYENVKKDISSWLTLLDVGGIMAGHDFGFPEVRRAVLDVFPEFPTSGIADIWVVDKRPPRNGNSR